MLRCDKCGFAYNNKTATHCISCGASLNQTNGLIMSDINDQEPKLEKATLPQVNESELLEYLNDYVIAQDLPKKELSRIIANHYTRAAYNLSTNGDKLDKTNIMLIGDSGSGKTFMIKKAAEKIDVPIVIQDATVFTTAGYIGRDVDSILTDLFIASGENLQRMEYGIVVLDEVDKIASTGRTNGPDVGGKAVQQSLLTMIESGKVEFPVSHSKDARRIQVDTSNILIIAAGAFNGLVSKKQKGKKLIGYTGEKTGVDPIIKQKDLIGYGMMAEFIGRMGFFVQLEPITPKLIKRIMLEPKNNIISQYKALYELKGSKWPLSTKDYNKIAKNLEDNVLGARGLRFEIETALAEKENVKED